MKSLKVHKASKTSTANKEVSMSNAQPDQASSSKEQQSTKEKEEKAQKVQLAAGVERTT